MNETQNTKRKYGNYCLRGQFGQIKRKCHTGTCVDKINKIPGAPTTRCRKGTRKCADQRCYPFVKKSNNSIKKTPFKILKDKPESLSSPKISSSNGVKIHPFMEQPQPQQQSQQYLEEQEELENSYIPQNFFTNKTRKSKKHKERQENIIMKNERNKKSKSKKSKRSKRSKRKNV